MTASTDASGSGIASAVPASASIPAGISAQLGERLDRDDVYARGRQLARELAGPGAQIENGSAEAYGEIRDRLRRVAGACAFVRIRDACEGRGGRGDAAPSSQH